MGGKAALLEAFGDGTEVFPPKGLGALDAMGGKASLVAALSAGTGAFPSKDSVLSTKEGGGVELPPEDCFGFAELEEIASFLSSANVFKGMVVPPNVKPVDGLPKENSEVAGAEVAEGGSPAGTPNEKPPVTAAVGTPKVNPPVPMDELDFSDLLSACVPS